MESRMDPLTSTESEPAPRNQRGFIEVLRFFGLARRPISRPIVGKKAYVRWWERLRAGIMLGAIVIVLGFVVAAVIGIVVLTAGFLLEQAIS